jgi:hypothetical protein
MKSLLFLAALIMLSSCYNGQQVQNHKGIREWKSGKQMLKNRRPNERPQCIDSW